MIQGCHGTGETGNLPTAFKYFEILKIKYVLILSWGKPKNGMRLLQQAPLHL